MQTKNINIVLQEFDDISELEENDRILLEKAREVVKNAYAPYSNFHVGAALELDNGKLITGSNQENAAFPSGLCAERVALFYANSRYPEVKINTLAVTSSGRERTDSGIVAPCGSCRQVMVETESRFKQDIRLILEGGNKIVVFKSSKSILPLAFTPDSLGK